MHAIQIQHRSGARGSSIHRISKPSKKPSTAKGMKKQSRSEEGREYKPAIYSPGTSVSFTENAEWDPSRLVAGTRKIVFERGFETREYAFPYYSLKLESASKLIYKFSSHIEAILSTGPALCNSLQHFEILNAGLVNNTSISKLSKACPGLVHVCLSMDLFKGKIGDVAVLALLKGCLGLRFLSVRGGKVTGSVVEKMDEDRNLGARLEKLCLLAQEEGGEWEEKVRALSGVRRLRVEIGEEEGNVGVWKGGKEQVLLSVSKEME
jgi:hypothetical protein